MPEPIPLPVERDDAGILTLRLEQAGSPVIVLDHPLIQRLEAALTAARQDTAARGLILASASQRVFVAGADLKTIQDWNDDQLDRYLAYGQRVFGMLADLPFPTAAAINGAALGGGLELAMHCDGLIAAPPTAGGKPYPIGLPESSLGICPAWGGTNLLPARMDPADAIQRAASGKTMMYEEAVAAGLFDAVAPAADQLMATARTWLQEKMGKGAVRRDGTPSRWIGRREFAPQVAEAVHKIDMDLPKTESARAVLEAVMTGLGEGGWPEALEVERRELIRLRSLPEGKAGIAAFFERSAKKSG